MASTIQEELEEVRRKAQERKDPGLDGLYTDGTGKRKAANSGNHKGCLKNGKNGKKHSNTALFSCALLFAPRACF